MSGPADAVVMKLKKYAPVIGIPDASVAVAFTLITYVDEYARFDRASVTTVSSGKFQL